MVFANYMRTMLHKDHLSRSRRVTANRDAIVLVSRRGICICASLQYWRDWNNRRFSGSRSSNRTSPNLYVFVPSWSASPVRNLGDRRRIRAMPGTLRPFPTIVALQGLNGLVFSRIRSLNKLFRPPATQICRGRKRAILGGIGRCWATLGSSSQFKRLFTGGRGGLTWQAN